MHFTPFEVLTAINHAQLRWNRMFKEEEFANGQVGKLMIAEDFDFEKAMSLTFYKLGRSQNTVPIASTQVAIKDIVQYSTRAQFLSRTVGD